METAVFCSFLWLSNIPFYILHIQTCIGYHIYICHRFLNQSPVDGLLGCFRVFAPVNRQSLSLLRLLC